MDFTVGGCPRRVLKGIDWETRSGEFLSILGPSGCGKTTLLRVLAGALRPAAGQIERIADAGDGVGGWLLVRQENALFPWMTALENAGFGLEMQRVPKAEWEARARKALADYGLAGFEDAYPAQLSLGTFLGPQNAMGR